MSNTFDSLIDSSVKTSFENLFNKTTPIHEFEVMFGNYKNEKNAMRSESFIKLLEITKFLSQKNKYKLEKNVSLDISYSGSYRISIIGLENINNVMETYHLRKNYVIFNNIIKNYLKKKEDYIKIMKKVKNKSNILDIDDFDVRARLSEELELTKDEQKILSNLKPTDSNKISFRLKHRSSLYTMDNNNGSVQIDLTDTKMSNNINNINNVSSVYELEIEFLNKTKNTPDKTFLNEMYSNITFMTKILQQSNYIISASRQKVIVKAQADLLGASRKLITINGRKAESLEIQHVVDKLPNKYAVTDKADGERFFLFIYEKMVYLISDNLHVKYTGIQLKDDKYNNTILDGENIFIKKQNRYIFMVFDCLYKANQNIRDENLFMNRLKHADEVIEQCFILEGQKGFKIKDYSGDYKVDKILDFNKKQIREYINVLNHDITKSKQFPLIRRKYFMAALGIQDNEIFKYSYLLWDEFVKNSNNNCPYTLDGMMLHPIDQKYITRESKFVEYKWKPEDKNSIDFYLTFQKNTDTGKDLILYDNSNDEFVRGKPYKVAHLHVGKEERGIEEPVLFQKESGKYVAKLFIQDGYVRDIENKLIEDKVVVEFYYNNDPTVPEDFRWVPMRTRYDKTEIVKKYGKKYGNYYNIANLVWRSIENPFLIGDINILANDSTYRQHIDVLRGKINHSIIMSERQENKFYQKMANMAKPLRAYFNWIGSITIYTYFNWVYENNKYMTILDIGCGNGQDLMKFYYVKTPFVLGTEVNNNLIISPVDGIISRYNRFKQTQPNFPPMSFINADPSVLFDLDSQERALGSMTKLNRDLITKYFGKDKYKFDRISCQLNIHNYLENDISWNNFVTNINNHLKVGGQMLITTLDADKIIDSLKDNNQFSITFSSKEGELETLFDIVKKYDKLSNIIGPGNAVDIFDARIHQEGKYVPYYLVQNNFIIKELAEKCNMELIETDLYENQYWIGEEYFNSYYKYEENALTRKFLQSVADFYDRNSEESRAAVKLMSLYRFYIFQKRS